jgi:hypothetical protein
MKTGIGLLLRLIAVGLCILALVLGARGMEAQGLSGPETPSPGSSLHPTEDAAAPLQDRVGRGPLSGVRRGSCLPSSTAAHPSATATHGQGGTEAAS